MLEWKKVKPMLKKGYRVTLDLGCGKGVFFKHLMNYTDILVGIDLNKIELNYAKKMKIYLKHRNRITLVNADASKLPFKEESFDLIWSNCVIEHIEDDINVFKEISRCLKRNGEFIATLPNSDIAQPSRIKRLLFSSKKWGPYFVSKDAAEYFKFKNIKNAELWFSIKRWEQARWGYSIQKLAKYLRTYNLKLMNFCYYFSSMVLEIWDLITFTRLNDLFPLNFILAAPVFHLIKEFDKGKSCNSACFAIKFNRLT